VVVEERDLNEPYENSKFQVPSSKEISNSKERLSSRESLEFGTWNFLGTWNLELGTLNFEL
jgi:hypothetical protein